MCRRSCVLCCCMFVFVASSSDYRRNFTNDDEQSRGSTVQYDFHAKDQNDRNESIWYNSRKNSTMKNYEFRINSTKNNPDNNDSMRYDFGAHMMKNDEESYGEMEPDSIKTRSMKNNDENNSASQEIYGNFTKTEGENNTVANNNNTFPPEECKNSSCIQLCCPRGHRLIQRKCVAGKGNYSFPDVYGYTSNDSSQSEDKSFDEVFHLIVHDSCWINKRHLLIPYHEYIGIFSNGSLYVPIYDRFVPWTQYCLGVMNQDAYDVFVCNTPYPIFTTIRIILSLLFLAATFVIYSILPELQNMHGYTVRAYIASWFVSYVIFLVDQQMALIEMGYFTCITLAYFLSFSFTATFLWLNVICFDIWQTFRQIRSSQGNTKQEERKKFMLYSIYALGSPLLLNIIGAIMDYIPDLSEYVIRPEHCKPGIWFSNSTAESLYFKLPVCITLICNICLFVITALNIVRHKKRTANDLKNSESKCHDDNKQRFMMYLKLLIVMGMTPIVWILEIIESTKSVEQNSVMLDAMWYLKNAIDTLQIFLIFVLFVCRKNIMRLLFKKLGWKISLLGRNSTSNDGRSSTTTTSRTVSLEEIPVPVGRSPRTEIDTNWHEKYTQDKANSY